MASPWHNTTHDWARHVDVDHLERIRRAPAEFAPGCPSTTWCGPGSPRCSGTAALSSPRVRGRSAGGVGVIAVGASVTRSKLPRGCDIQRLVHNPASSTYDETLTKVAGRLVKVSGWYDNEWGYSSRCVDLLRMIGARLGA